MSSQKIFRIFVVEDNPADIYLLRLALESAGLNFDLTVIDDGAVALKYIQNQAAGYPKPDLAVLDLNMAANDGFEILAAIRQNEHLLDLPVAVVTSSAAASDRIQMEQLGIETFITKPPDLDDFLKIGQTLKGVLLAHEADLATR